MSDEQVLKDLFKDKVKQKEAETGVSKGKDEIVVIVDRSGSMSSIKEDAQGGLNSFIEEQKKVEGGANLTIVEFDTMVDTVCDRVDLNEAQEYVLSPRGGTALLDAIGLVISNDLKYKAEDDGKTIVVVVTDGGENSSREWKRDDIFKLINERKEQGWEFMFLAANQDAISTATHYGFDANASASFDNSAKGVAHAFGMSSLYSTELRSVSKDAALAKKKEYVDAHQDVLSETGAVDKSETES